MAYRRLLSNLHPHSESTQMKWIYRVGILIVLCFTQMQAQAAHIVGGVITYVCNGGNSYTFTLKLYRDCAGTGAQFDNSIDLFVFQASNTNLSSPDYILTANFPGSTSVPDNFYNPCVTLPPNICVEQAVYTFFANLPPVPGGYNVLWQRCCRTQITNIVNSASNPVGATYACHVPDSTIATCNSSPTFNNFPPTIVCQGLPFSFDHSATDVDGDSLVYSLCDPLDGGSQTNTTPNPPVTFNPVVWQTPYGLGNLLGGTPALSINPITGLLSGTPNTVGRFVVGVCVSEYRNGILLSTTLRDFQFNVTNCQTTVNAVAPSVPVTCNTYTINFANNSFPINPLTNYYWDFGVSGITTDTSTQKTPSYTYPDSGTYHVMYVMNPGLPCADTAFLIVKVYPFFKAGFAPSLNPTCPLNPVQFFDTTICHSGGLNYWRWNFGDGSPDSYLQNPNHLFTNLGNYTVKLFVSNTFGCQDSITQVIGVIPPPPPVTDTLPPNCTALTIQMTPPVVAGSYYWDFGIPGTNADTSHLQHPVITFPQPDLYKLMLITFPLTLCAETSYYFLPLYPTLHIDFSTQNVCVTFAANFMDQSTTTFGNMNTWAWNFGDGSAIVSGVNATSHLYSTADTFNVSLIATNSIGCKDTATHPLIIYPLPVINLNQDTLICYLDTVHLHASGGGTYIWSPNYNISSTTISNPLANPSFPVTYSVIVTTPYGCVDTDSVAINTFQTVNANVWPLDTIICVGQSVPLHCSGADFYVWSPDTFLTTSLLAPFVSAPPATIIYLVASSIGSCIDYDTVRIQVLPFPTPDAGPSQTICLGSYADLVANGGTDYKWSPDYFIDFLDRSHVRVSPLQTTTYTVSVFDQRLCPGWKNDSLIITVDDFQGANAGSDTTIIRGYPAMLHGSGGVAYHWEPGTGLSSQDIANPLAAPNDDVTYVLKVTNSNGCMDYDTVHITVYPGPEVYLPTAFTPNGDGLDDQFMPMYIGIAKLSEFTVYNRWGTKVFTTRDIHEGWDGRFRTKLQELGVYVWYVSGTDIAGHAFFRKGDVTLIR